MDTALRSFWLMSRTVLSPAKIPLVIEDFPSVPILEVTVEFVLTREKTALSESTRLLATELTLAASRATLRVTGSVDTAETVTDTPGSRSAKVLLAEVITCSAEVPPHSVIFASCAVLIMAAPGAASTSLAAETSAGAPVCTSKDELAPVVVLENWMRYWLAPDTGSVPAAIFVAVTPAAELLIALTTSSSEFEAGVISMAVPSCPTIVRVPGDGQAAIAAETPIWEVASALTTTCSSPLVAPVPAVATTVGELVLAL